MKVDGITGNSLALVSCVTNQIIFIRNSRPIITQKSDDITTQTASSFLINN